MLSEKERLEEELRFLKESYDIGVIDEGEFEQGKKRIQKKLESLEETDSSAEPAKGPEQTTEIKIREIEPGNNDLQKEIDSAAEKIVEQSKQESIPLTRKVARKPRKIEEESVREAPEKKTAGQKAEDSSKKKEQAPKRNGNGKKKTVETETKAPEKAVESREKTEIKQETEKVSEDQDTEKVHAEEVQSPEEEEDSLGMGWIAVVIVVVFLAAFGFWFFSQNPMEPTDTDTITEAACSSDADCVQGNMVGTCLNPGAARASCTFEAKLPIKVITVQCSSCDSEYTLSVIRKFFPNLDVEELSYDSVSGQALMEQFDIDALPAYVFDGSITSAVKFKDLKTSLEEIKGSYVLKNNVANANFYVKRSETPTQLDVFVKPGEKITQDVERNLAEFITAFGDGVKVVRHANTVRLARDFDINTFPAFVVNNRMKFNGLQSANTIKEHYCSMNDLAACEQELSKSLV